MATVKLAAPYVAAMISGLAINTGLLNGSLVGFIGIYFGLVSIILAINFEK